MHDDLRDEEEVGACRRGEVVRESYVVGDVLGIGGMGIVYAAVHAALDRTVALKLPRPELAADPMVRRQFQMEAIAGARIRHRNVVSVLDYGEYQSAPYLVMEHLAGPRLGELVLDQGPLPLPVAVDLVRQLLDGLAEAHALGIIHGDMKSDNVLVETLRDGTMIPRIIDFGLARFPSSPPPSSDDDPMVAGTPDYLAPELLRGAPPTFVSDVYAMGIVCYELLTGLTPFGGGTSAEIMDRQLRDVVVPMSCRRPGVPDALDRLVGRALGKIPETRFASAAAMADALEGLAIDLRSSSSSREDGCPILCSPEATTSPMGVPVPRTRSRLAMGTPDPLKLRIEQRRDEVMAALRAGDVDEVVLGYLDLARALVDARDLPTAISELERGIELLIRGDSVRRDAPIWRLQLTLAALHDGNGDRPKACNAMREAHALASFQGSATGQQRAVELFHRLVRAEPAARFPTKRRAARR